MGGITGTLISPMKLRSQRAKAVSGHIVASMDGSIIDVSVEVGQRVTRARRC